MVIQITLKQKLCSLHSPRSRFFFDSRQQHILHNARCQTWRPLDLKLKLLENILENFYLTSKNFSDHPLGSQYLVTYTKKLSNILHDADLLRYCGGI